MKQFLAFTIVAMVAGCSSHKKTDDAGLLPDGGLRAGPGQDGGLGGGVHAGGTGSSKGGSGASGAVASDGGALPGSEWVNPTGIVDGGFVIPDALMLCGDRACACADGMDNDGDGVADGFDTECTGPNDDDEATFATGIPGDNRDPKWQDCFFDGNSGAGDDRCRYSTGCLTGELPQSDKDCTLAQDCLDFCAQRTPNGCDCFGCCSILGDDGKNYDVLITDKCDATDLAACEMCVKSADCGNTCGECELCPGKSVADLPASCFPPPPPPTGTGGTGTDTPGTGGTTAPPPPPRIQCDAGRTVCAATSECLPGQYCSYGCCVQPPPI